MSWTLLEDWKPVEVMPVALAKAVLSLMDQIPKEQWEAAGKMKRIRKTNSSLVRLCSLRETEPLGARLHHTGDQAQQ